VRVIPYVGFRIGALVHLAVEARSVRAVARASGIEPVPFARRCVSGVIVRDGRIVPVFDLSRIASIWNEVPEGGGDQVIVVASGEREAGLLARGAETFTCSEEGESEDSGAARPLAAVREAILSGVRRVRGREFGILRVEAALAAAEVPAD